MGERPTLSVLPAVRELRPAEDLSLMRIDELRSVLGSPTVRTPVFAAPATTSESFRLVAPPLASEPQLGTGGNPAPAGSWTRATEETEPPAQRIDAGSKFASPSPAAPLPNRSADLPLLTAAGGAGSLVQPYGFEPGRVRQLLDQVLDFRAATASVLAPRAAGDLVDVPNRESDVDPRLRAVSASERSRP